MTRDDFALIGLALFCVALGALVSTWMSSNEVRYIFAGLAAIVASGMIALVWKGRK